MTLAVWAGIIAAGALAILMFGISVGVILRRASEDLEHVVHRMRGIGRAKPTQPK